MRFEGRPFGLSCSSLKLNNRMPFHWTQNCIESSTYDTSLEEKKLSCLWQSLKSWFFTCEADWLPPEAAFSITAKRPFNFLTDVHACLPLILVRGAHGLQEESRPHPKRVKSDRIGGLEGWYNLAPATQSNMISVMNGGKNPNIQILSQTCHYILFLFLLFLSFWNIFKTYY